MSGTKRNRPWDRWGPSLGQTGRCLLNSRGKIAILSRLSLGQVGVRPWHDGPTRAVKEMFMCLCLLASYPQIAQKSTFEQARSSFGGFPKFFGRVCVLIRFRWSHKPVSLNGRLKNCEIGGCKEIRQPFANPVPTLCQPFANLSPFTNPLPTFSANPSPAPSFCGPQAPVQRHGLTDSWVLRPPMVRPWDDGPARAVRKMFMCVSVYCFFFFAQF